MTECIVWSDGEAVVNTCILCAVQGQMAGYREVLFSDEAELLHSYFANDTEVIARQGSRTIHNSVLPTKT